MEINRVKAEYADKISKAQSDKFTAESNQFDAEAQVTKLESDFTSYEMRNDLYYIRAPQDGFINKAIKGGIGETFKEGEQLVGIMPSNYDLAVEMFVDPIDLPLVHLNEKVRVQFDGWPAIVFSGWPNISYGTYGAKVVAIERFISSNGKFRVLLAPDERGSSMARSHSGWFWSQNHSAFGRCTNLVRAMEKAQWISSKLLPTYRWDSVPKLKKNNIEMNRNLSLIFVFIISFINAQESDSIVLSFSEYLGYVKKHHPIAKQADLTIQIGQANLMKARGGFDPKIEVDNERKKFKNLEYFRSIGRHIQNSNMVWYRT